MEIHKRLPTWSQVASLYSVIITVLYTWTMLWFFWKFSSWLYFLTIWEIVKIFCYSMATNLLESLIVLVPFLALAVILPRKLFLDEFVSRSVPAALIGLGYMIYLANQFQGKEDYPSDVLHLAPVVLLVILLTVFVVGKIAFLRMLIENLADRTIVLLYISIPVSLVCLLVVLAACRRESNVLDTN